MPNKQTDPIPPEGCTCGALWTVRGKHGKKDCPYRSATSPTRPNEQTNGEDELDRCLHFAIKAAQAHYSGEPPVLSPGDAKWVGTLPDLIQDRELEAYDKGIDEAYKHLYTASQVSEAIRRALLSKTNPKMINAVIEDVGDELQQLGQGEKGEKS